MADLLLPPALAKDARFRALAQLAERLGNVDLSPLLVYLIDDVDASALPFLADQFSVMGEDGWSLAESDEARRTLIKGAIELHRYKGTPWAVREVIRRLGFGEVELVENIARVFYDGKRRYNGWMVHGDPGLWAVYRVILLDRAITNDQAALLRATLAAFAPARCLLASLEYRGVPVRYNGAARYDGQYNHGSS
ncbi:phage tail protein [Burkholderia ubonensis]|uniref:Phage tail protein n=1 Tax=Burkholderia ubonensis TaxID=101571 RepID=A0ABD4DV74_9BURK|nr:phage tail protein I [Burkholderia ubonensis]KVN76047.1 phage tail protein [Burkholderia ubonensis]KVX59540.1 phage tail protein [Burkholderia ubonensis]KVZ56109.1 phage tail protein [Burkholderia ubonensis]KVZ81099.1 phage tail protein [Burkholderia ubonensis]